MKGKRTFLMLIITLFTLIALQVAQATDYGDDLRPYVRWAYSMDTIDMNSTHLFDLGPLQRHAAWNNYAAWTTGVSAPIGEGIEAPVAINDEIELLIDPLPSKAYWETGNWSMSYWLWIDNANPGTTTLSFEFFGYSAIQVGVVGTYGHYWEIDGGAWFKISCGSAQTNEDSWEHYVMRHFSNGTFELYRNATYKCGSKTDTSLDLSGANVWSIYHNSFANQALRFDEAIFFNTTLTNDEMLWLYNGSGMTLGYNWTAPEFYFKIDAHDANNNTDIDQFNATINGSKTFNTTTSLITTTINSSLGNVMNVTVFSPGYFPKTYLNHNTTNQLNAYLDYYARVDNFDFYNFTTINQSGTLKNWTRNIYYWINATCDDQSNVSIDLWMNGSRQDQYPLSCDNRSRNWTRTVTWPDNGAWNITLWFNHSNDTHDQKLYENNLFYFDTENPTAEVNLSLGGGFGNELNISMVCADLEFTNITYNMTLTGLFLNYGNFSNNTRIWNTTTSPNSTNEIVGVCCDLYGCGSATYEFTVFSKEIILIDEITGDNFNYSNISSCVVYFDDNSSSFDFKSEGTNKVNFTSLTQDKLRFEFQYLTGDTPVVTRYVDVGLVDDPLRVCANKEGVTHYTQYVRSANQREAVVESMYANCIVAADYTRFTYQDSYILQYFTRATQYQLYTFDEASRVYLANIDGSISSYNDIDYLEFLRQQTIVQVQSDAIGIFNNMTDITTLYYYNLAGDNDWTLMRISRMDTGSIVYTLNESTTPNNFTVYYNYGNLSNVTNSTVFKVAMTLGKNDRTQRTFNRYYTTTGRAGSITNGFAVAISILLMLFGITFLAARFVFSWFGILICLASLAILSLAPGAWYVTFLMALYVIVMVFMAIVMSNKNQSTVS